MIETKLLPYSIDMKISFGKLELRPSFNNFPNSCLIYTKHEAISDFKATSLSYWLLQTSILILFGNV